MSTGQLIAVVAVAAAIGSVVAGRLPTSPDDSLYRSLATSLTTGRGYTDTGGSPFTIRPPGFPALLAPTIAIAGPMSAAPWLLQAVLFGTFVAMAWLVLRQFVGGTAALVALALLASAPELLNLGRTLRIDVLHTLVSLLAVALISAAGASGNRGLAIVGGITAGVSILVKETSLVLLALPLAWWIANGPRRGLSPMVVATTAMVATIAPWWAYVAIATGRLFPTFLGGSLLPSAVVLATTSALVGLAVIDRLVAARPAEAFDAPLLRLVCGIGLIALAAIALGVLVVGGNPQLDVVGDPRSDLRRFLFDEVLAELGPATPVLLMAAPGAILAWRAGGRPREFVVLGIVCVPIVLLTAIGARSIRSALLPLLVVAALAAWTLQSILRATLGGLAVAASRRRFRLRLASRALVAATCLALLAAGMSATLATGRYDPGPVGDWSSPQVVEAAAALAQATSDGGAAVVPFTYGAELFTLERGRVPMPQIPTLQFRLDRGTCALTPTGTLARFTPLSRTEAARGIADLAWLRAVPGGTSYTGLALADLLATIRRYGARTVVLSGESFRSTTALGPVLLTLPGFSENTVIGEGPDRIVILRVDPALVPREPPTPGIPLLVDGPTLRALAADWVGPCAPMPAAAADRISLVAPFDPADATLLDALRAGSR